VVASAGPEQGRLEAGDTLRVQATKLEIRNSSQRCIAAILAARLFSAPRVAHDWDRAVVTNDAEAIGRFLADEWVIVGSGGSLCSKADSLGLVKSGELSHEVMTSEEMDVRVYDDAAVVVARGVSAGKYQGQPFREVERATSVFIRQAGEWKCVATHLSRLAQMAG
jgi:ketosteroid isomerase-like protein